jgi:hypothetical protein
MASGGVIKKLSIEAECQERLKKQWGLLLKKKRRPAFIGRNHSTGPRAICIALHKSGKHSNALVRQIAANLLQKLANKSQFQIIDLCFLVNPVIERHFRRQFNKVCLVVTLAQ